MGFVAREAVARLDYDFTGVVGDDGDPIAGLDGAAGVTPEPTQRQVRTMRLRLRRFYKLDQDADDDAIVEAQKAEAKRQQQLSDEDLEREAAEQAATLSEIYADVCSQQPTTEQVEALPHRIREVFIGYMNGELLNPTEGSSDTKSSPAPLKSVK